MDFRGRAKLGTKLCRDQCDNVGLRPKLVAHRADFFPRDIRRITINIYPGAGHQDILLNLDIFPDMTLSTLRDSIQAEAQIPPASQHIYHNGGLINDDAKTMEQLNIRDGDMLAMNVRNVRPASTPQGNTARSQPTQPQQPRQGQAPDPEFARLAILENPTLRQRLQEGNAQLAAALNDPARFAQIFREGASAEQRQREDRQREIQRLNDDQFDPQAQAKIEEMIRQENVMQNLQNAMEHHPEGKSRIFDSCTT